MPELRKDPIVGRWVIIATERGKRPTDFVSPTHKRRVSGFCPFCAGNEYTTPEELYAVRQPGSEPNGPGWSLRVVPNKFPALKPEGEPSREGVGLYDKLNGVGTHEVIIESPDHLSSLATMERKAVEDVLWAYYHRIEALKKDPRFKYVMVFKNEGEIAGASLEHTHSQLIGLPIVPKLVKEEISSAKHYFSLKERCIFCDIITQETEMQERVIIENEEYIALAPFAARLPFETWIMPKTHVSSYRPTEKGFSTLAEILQIVLQKLDKLLNIPPYNYIIHTSSFEDEDNEYYHWHMEIIPKLTKIAGFEWGTGFYINPTPPEVATRFMKEVEK
ncbi:MAG: galactose-1-phosphate uridylyltransferase [Nitrospirae bacterium]|nr:MAG: galactose-1-phosphate uridylyltransferase [Nitrospirota bacterium]